MPIIARLAGEKSNYQRCHGKREKRDGATQKPVGQPQC
jgi:hypothetical protein